jgi:hypothetical protein
LFGRSGSDGVKGVDDGEDAGDEWDLLAAEVVGVAAAVPRSCDSCQEVAQAMVGRSSDQLEVFARRHPGTLLGAACELRPSHANGRRLGPSKAAEAGKLRKLRSFAAWLGLEGIGWVWLGHVAARAG